ncbi:MAG: nucleoside phosphorylase [Candidatus Hodarchaeales archaeon]|jgi:uridine phosphorylase
MNSTPSKSILNSEVVEDTEKRQYHIALAPGEIAPTIILVGDPARAKKVSDFFDEIHLSRSNREFITYTGLYQDTPISVIATGIGSSNVEIAVIELSHITSTPLSLIRVGTCGGLPSYINVGDLVISTGSVRLEDTSLYFVDSCFPAVAHYEIISALIKASEDLNDVNYHLGLTASASGFYGAQGREIPNFPINDKSIPDKLQARNVLNFEMESSTLFTLATLAGYRAGTVCTVYANRTHNTFIPAEHKDGAEKLAILCGLNAAVVLKQMDKMKKEHNLKYWHPGLSIG